MTYSPPSHPTPCPPSPPPHKKRRRWGCTLCRFFFFLSNVCFLFCFVCVCVNCLCMWIYFVLFFSSRARVWAVTTPSSVATWLCAVPVGTAFFLSFLWAWCTFSVSSPCSDIAVKVTVGVTNLKFAKLKWLLFSDGEREQKHACLKQKGSGAAVTNRGYYWGENKRSYGLMPSHVPLEATNCSRKIGCMHQDTS